MSNSTLRRTPAPSARALTRAKSDDDLLHAETCWNYRCLVPIWMSLYVMRDGKTLFVSAARNNSYCTACAYAKWLASPVRHMYANPLFERREERERVSRRYRAGLRVFKLVVVLTRLGRRNHTARLVATTRLPARLMAFLV